MNEHFTDVLDNLEYGRDELPLMLKIIDYLRSIDSKIGNPLNSFVILVSNYFQYSKFIQKIIFSLSLYIRSY